jgi:hypothetical protein
MKKILMILLICSFFTAISFAEDINSYVDRESKVQDQLKIGEVVQLGTDSVVEKNGVIYIVGNSTPREREDQLATYRQRMEKREKQVQEELDRALAIRLKEIEAQAMLDYLLAEALVYGNATRPQPTEFNIKGSRASAIANGGNVGNLSLQGGTNNVTATGGTGGSATNKNKNTANGGTGGKGGNATGGSVGDLTLTARTGSVTANGGTATANSTSRVGNISNDTSVSNILDIINCNKNTSTNNNQNNNFNDNENTNCNSNTNNNNNNLSNTNSGGSNNNDDDNDDCDDNDDDDGCGHRHGHDNNGWGNGGDSDEEGDDEQTNPGNHGNNGHGNNK